MIQKIIFIYLAIILSKFEANSDLLQNSQSKKNQINSNTKQKNQIDMGIDQNINTDYNTNANLNESQKLLQGQQNIVRQDEGELLQNATQITKVPQKITEVSHTNLNNKEQPEKINSPNINKKIDFDEIVDLDKSFSDEDFSNSHGENDEQQKQNSMYQRIFPKFQLNEEKNQQQTKNSQQKNNLSNQQKQKNQIAIGDSQVKQNFQSDNIYDYAEIVGSSQSNEEIQSDESKNLNMNKAKSNDLLISKIKSEAHDITNIFNAREDLESGEDGKFGQSQKFNKKVCNYNLVYLFLQNKSNEAMHKNQFQPQYQNISTYKNLLCRDNRNCCNQSQYEDIIFLVSIQLKKELKNLQNLIKFFYLIQRLGDLQPLITQNLDKLQDCLLDDFDSLKEILEYLKYRQRETIKKYFDYSLNLFQETVNLYCYLCSINQKDNIKTTVQNKTIYFSMMINQKQEMLSFYKKFSSYYKFEKLLKFTRILQCVYFQQKYPNRNIDIKTFLNIQQKNENDLSNLHEDSDYKQLFQEQYLPAYSKIFIFEDLLQMFQSVLLEHESQYKMNLFPLGSWYPFAQNSQKFISFIQDQTQIIDNENGYASEIDLTSQNFQDYLKQAYDRLFKENIIFIQEKNEDQKVKEKKGIFQSLISSFKQIYKETFNQFREN